MRPENEPQDLIQYRVRNAFGDSVEVGARKEHSDRIWTTWSVQVRMVKGDVLDLRQFSVQVSRSYDDRHVMGTILNAVISHGVSLDVIHQPDRGNSSLAVLASPHPDSPQEEPS